MKETKFVETSELIFVLSRAVTLLFLRCLGLGTRTPWVILIYTVTVQLSLLINIQSEQ